MSLMILGFPFLLFKIELEDPLLLSQSFFIIKRKLIQKPFLPNLYTLLINNIIEFPVIFFQDFIFVILFFLIIFHILIATIQTRVLIVFLFVLVV